MSCSISKFTPQIPFPARNMPKVLFVPVSIVGCGKSTVFRALRHIYPGLKHIENDNFGNKATFYEAIHNALKDDSTSGVLLDRNNHLPMHRKEIMSQFRTENLVIVALLFVPKHTSAQKLRSLVLARIASRGDNHPQVKGKSDFAKAKMIVNSFVRNFVAYDPEDPVDRQFDHVIEMNTSPESSEENVKRIVHYCNSLSDQSQFPSVSDSQIERELKRSLEFQVKSD